MGNRLRAAATLALLPMLALTLCVCRATPATAAGIPHINHLFVIVLENEDADESFGANPPAPYLGKTLKEAGVFMPSYFGIGHNSLDNYIAMISGQPPNMTTQADCPIFSNMLPGTLNSAGIAVGQGCVYPRTVQTVAGQLEKSGQSWRGYMQDMANSVGAGDPATCRHPAIGGPDETEAARPSDQYATRHDPFVYFHSIIDSPACQRNVVDLRKLPRDLHREKTTPNYVFITPDLCADGHDATCADGTSPAGFAGINAFLRKWVPTIRHSAAYKDDGALLVTFDESETGGQSCCNETSGPNTTVNGG
ncbi:MAG TPA: alkaline phosphatase family protein, partial [Solirubrobacterales bacterium]|nr:alkaline phosphatase family protein [Solirubrobacterales bacterium]